MKISAIVLTFALCLGIAASSAAAQDTATKTPAAAKAPAKPKTATKPAAKAATGAKTSANAATGAKPTTKIDKASYALGMNLGTGMRKQGVPINPTVFSQGLRDALAGKKTLLTDDEARAALTELQGDARAKQMEKVKQMAEGNKKTGAAYLAANKSKAGVVTLPSGLQYKILTAGTGPKPLASDTVVCNYKGTLINGTEFDSSYKRGEPATFPVGGVIKGWTEALQLMPAGSKWQLFIPSDLAYGDNGAGKEIEPGSTLIFEVELMSIQPKEADKKGEKKDESK